MIPLEARVESDTNIGESSPEQSHIPREEGQFNIGSTTTHTTIKTYDEFGPSGKLYVARQNGKESVTGGECYMLRRTFRVEMVDVTYMGTGWGVDTSSGTLFMYNERDFENVKRTLMSARMQYPG